MRKLFVPLMLWAISLAGLLSQPAPAQAQAPTRISSFAPNGTMVWTNAQGDRVYRIQTTTKPGQSWTNLGSDVQGTGTVMQVTVPMTNALAFFRIADMGTCCTNNGGTNFSSAVSLGAYCADGLANQVSVSGCGNAWYRVRANECNTSLGPGNDLKVNVTLTVPAGMDYDLYLYNSSGTQTYGSFQGVNTPEAISFTVADPAFTTSNESFDFGIEVRRYSGLNCAAWTLTATLGGP